MKNKKGIRRNRFTGIYIGMALESVLRGILDLNAVVIGAL